VLISQWLSGKYVEEEKFTEIKHQKLYLTHLKAIQTWCNGTPTVTQKIRVKLFKRLLYVLTYPAQRLLIE
jgi:hypothetical protein